MVLVDLNVKRRISLVFFLRPLVKQASFSSSHFWAAWDWACGKFRDKSASR